MHTDSKEQASVYQCPLSRKHQLNRSRFQRCCCMVDHRRHRIARR